MTHLSRATMFCTAMLMAGCGPKADSKTPLGEGTPAPSAGDEQGTTVQFMGVSYAVTATPVELSGGWGVRVAVDAVITDDREHAFVHDVMAAGSDPTSLRFGAVYGEEVIDEPRYTGSLGLETRAPGEAIVFERTFEGVDGAGVPAGETLELVAGIWGTEHPGAEQRYAPDLVRVVMTVGEGAPGVVTEVLDPGSDLPDDFITWEIGSHKLVVKPFAPLKQNAKTNASETVSVYEVGDTVVRIKGSDLVVNDQYFGKMAGGDGVLVDHGKVSVGGKDRQAEPIAQKDLLGYHVVAESEHDLAGYKIVVSPGASKFGTVSMGDKHRLVIDQREVVIENGILFVDGVSYGEVKPKSKIKIFFDEISVGKKTLTPVTDPEP